MNNRRLISAAIIILLIAMLGGFNLSLYLLYQKSVTTLDKSLGDRLLSVGRAIAPEIESVLDVDLIAGELSLQNIVRLQDYLARVRESDQLSGLYLADTQNRDLLALDDSLPRLELILPLHAEALSRAQLGESSVSPLYSADKRYFKSAFHPVGSDSVLAVLVIESSFEFFSDFNDYRRHLIVVNIAAVLALALVAIIIVLLNRRLVRTERLLVSQAALTQMGQMTAIIAHEIRNPLGIIKATAERLKTKFAPLAGSDRQLFDFIPEEVDRLNQITTHYLQFAAPADAHGAAEEIGAIIESIKPGLTKEAERRNIEFASEVPPDSSALAVDSVAVRQILVNLVRNAIDATPARGRVSLNASIAGAGKLRLEISDSGSGIDKQTRKHIFDPFFTTKIQGTGLGLFVVKRLLDRLNGTIDLESLPGRGTRVTLIIPESSRGKDSRS